MLTLFFWYALIVVACATMNGHGLRQTQLGSYSSKQLHHENKNQVINSQFNSHTQAAEDRSLHAQKYHIKRKKRKYKLFKKHFKKCGDPFNFKFIKRADDDPDTISIKLPYGFGDEYYPEGIQTNDENIDSDEGDEEEFGKFTQKMTPVWAPSFNPSSHFRVTAYKPNRLAPQRIFSRHPPWIPVTPSKISNSQEPIPGELHHSSLRPKPLLGVKTLEIPTERNNAIPNNYVYQNIKRDVEPKRRFRHQSDFYKFYNASTRKNESRTDKEKVVTVTPITPFYHADDSWMPVLDSTNGIFQQVFPRTDEPEIITGKTEIFEILRNHSRTII